MLIKPPAPFTTPCRKPHLHTRKNHDTYNGILHIPQATHVQITTNTTTPNTTNTATVATTEANIQWLVNSRTTGAANPRAATAPTYIVTLSYPHNRACELRRSADDLLALRRALVSAMCRLQQKREGKSRNNNNNNNNSSSSSSSSRVDGKNAGNSNGSRTGIVVPAATQRCACSCSCCCCPCDWLRPDVRLAREVNELLEKALKMIADGKGVVAMRLAVERFLRRRIGDCGGG
ncbi:hypothetical protein C7999DRAFT_27608 [Corynascus novoguineensis]|uniref:Uncharacterized protein n=1 Tax=Corynascus novoguineensis TaxID=1126955 RepID=A0AAN7D1F5_9PEZI|nr:hypothetical protein C7999DRAFT_27608 [Corynascus novoguineensis]